MYIYQGCENTFELNTIAKNTRKKCDTIRISFVFVFAKDSRYVRPVISLEFSRNIIKHLKCCQEQIENDF